MHGLCGPLGQLRREEALKSDGIDVDATGVLVQAKEQYRRGLFWEIVSDNRHILSCYTKRNNKGHVKELLGCERIAPMLFTAETGGIRHLGPPA